jgi:transketolase
MGIEPLQEKFLSLKWGVEIIDGHDYQQIFGVMSHLPIEVGKPSAVIANTVKGRGVSFMEETHTWHYKVMTDEEFRAALAELTGTKRGQEKQNLQ